MLSELPPTSFNLTKYFIIGGGVITVAFVIVLASAAGFNILPFEANFERTGQFGDSFGALSALMGMVAASSAFAAYQSQAEELKRLKKSEDGKRRSDDRRDFENTFFNLIKIFREQVSQTNVDYYRVSTGIDAFDQIRQILSERRAQNENTPSEYNKQIFDEVYFGHRNKLGHYFRLFYHILKFIHDSDVEDKMRYVRILRSLLSNSEIVLIALNCAFGSGDPKLKELIEKYSIVHNISSSDAQQWNLTTLLEKNAFGDRTINDDGSLSL